jgi:hypothetical protein
MLNKKINKIITLILVITSIWFMWTYAANTSLKTYIDNFSISESELWKLITTFFDNEWYIKSEFIKDWSIVSSKLTENYQKDVTWNCSVWEAITEINDDWTITCAWAWQDNLWNHTATQSLNLNWNQINWLDLNWWWIVGDNFDILWANKIKFNDPWEWINFTDKAYIYAIDARDEDEVNIEANKVWIWTLTPNSKLDVNGDITENWTLLSNKYQTKIVSSCTVWQAILEIKNDWTVICWWSLSSPIPYIKTTVSKKMWMSTTKNIILDWDNFTPNSIVEIPWFDWTINSTTPLSKYQLETNITSWPNNQIYNIVVSNNWILNTLWAWNWAWLLNITENIWDSITWYGDSKTFGILAEGFFTGTPTTIINWDIWYVSLESTPTVNGTTYVSPHEMYNSAISDKNTAKDLINNEECDYTAPAAIDLFNDDTHYSWSNNMGSLNIYTPWVYCIGWAISISGDITLSGDWIYIFKSVGALTSAASIDVLLDNGASACDITWVPDSLTTWANVSLNGTVIANSAITLGADNNINGRLFWSTITTAVNSLITVPGCN